MDAVDTDVVVVGAGGAGLLAALAARQAGADVLLLGKAPAGRGTCTAMAAGIFSAPSQGFSEDAHLEATLEAGRGLNDRARVEQLVERARPALEALRRAGAPLEAAGNGYRIPAGDRPTVPGIRLAQWLRRRVREAGVREAPLRAIDLVVAEGEAAGVTGVSPDDRTVFVRAGAVVLASGGGAALYPRHDNPPGIAGDGLALALRAGCALRDMEFVQFYPVGFAEPGLPTFLVYPPYPPGTRLWDARGRNALEDLPGCRDLNDAIIRFRDHSALRFQRAHEEGGLFLDFTAVAPELWGTHWCLRRLARSAFDFRRRRFRVAPLAHFTIGGVEVDRDAATSVPGLFAAGEVTGGLHGANRLGGNALTECAVCGPIAGERAAARARERGRPAAAGSQVLRLLPADPGPGVRPEYGELRRAARRVAGDHAGIVRDGEGIRRGLGRLDALWGELTRLPPRGTRDVRAHADATSALLVLRCILEAGRRRQESRGAFFRSDHPETDEERWRVSQRVRLDGADRLAVETVGERR
ncbi:MAG: L-aspartate oxidase [Deferrisomatales bacterium]